MLLYLLLLAPCLATVRTTERYIEAECERSYARQRHFDCTGDPDERWNMQSSSQGVFAGMSDALAKNRSQADKICEQACARTNACRAYSISSAAHYLSGKYECRVYYSCTATADDNFDLYVRNLPYNCFIKGTSFDGIFSNFGEVGGELVQTQRLLRIETKPFQEVHFSINGVPDLTAYAYRPYKQFDKKFYCAMDEDPLNCVLLNADFLSVIFFFLFMLVLAWNAFLIIGVLNK